MRARLDPLGQITQRPLVQRYELVTERVVTPADMRDLDRDALGRPQVASWLARCSRLDEHRDDPGVGVPDERLAHIEDDGRNGIAPVAAQAFQDLGDRPGRITLRGSPRARQPPVLVDGDCRYLAAGDAHADSHGILPRPGSR